MKTLDQTRTDAQLMLMLRALANPARFRIFQELRRRQSCQSP